MSLETILATKKIKNPVKEFKKELKEILPEKKQARIIALLNEIEEELDRTNYFDDMA